MNCRAIQVVLWATSLLVGMGGYVALAAGPDAEIAQLRVDDFGVQSGAPVSNGFVFVEGAYLDAPYTVSRRGLAVFVNNTIIRDARARWPPRDVLVNDEPAYPAGLTTESSFADIDEKYKDPYDAPWHREYRYAHQHFPREEAYRKMQKWFEGLPFVSSAELEHGGRLLVVTTRAGEKRNYGIGVSGESYGVVKPLTKEIVIRDLEYVRARYEKWISQGDCFFIFSSASELFFGPGRAKQILPDIVDTLDSGEPPDVKVQRLTDLGLVPPTWTKAGRKLVDGFRKTPQLAERVRQLRSEPNAGRGKQRSFAEERAIRAGPPK